MRRFILALFLIGIFVRGARCADDSLYSSDALASVEEDLRTAQAANPADMAAYTNYVRFLMRQLKIESAQRLLKPRESATDPTTQLLRAEYDFYSGAIADLRREAAAIPQSAPEWAAAQLMLVQGDLMENQRDQAEQAARVLLDHQPANIDARTILAGLQARRGDYAAAEKTLSPLDAVSTASLELLEARAELLEAQGQDEKARQLRETAANSIDANRPATPHALCAGAAAMRGMAQPRAADQCIEIALRYIPADPAVQLEAARLHASTDSFDESIKIVLGLLKRYPKWAEGHAILSGYFSQISEYKSASEECEMALANDPQCVPALRQLAFYRLCLAQPDAAQDALKKLKTINPTDREAQDLADEAALLASNAAPDAKSKTKSTVALGTAQILLARGTPHAALDWLNLARTLQPDNPRVYHTLGLACLSVTDFTSATKNFEQAFALNPFDYRSHNELELLDTFGAAKLREKQGMRLAYASENEALAPLIEYETNRALAAAQQRWKIATAPTPLRVQLCGSKKDLDVLRKGMPFGCCGTAEARAGMFYSEGTFYLIEPHAAAYDTQYRLDEALYRGAALHALESAYPGLPVWLREGLVLEAQMQANPEWTPPQLSEFIASLRMGNALQLSQVDEGWTVAADEYCRIYPALLLREWREQYGNEKIDKLLHTARTADSTKTLEAILGKPVAELEKQGREAMLKRYVGLNAELLAFPPLNILTEEAKYSDAGKVRLAQFYLAAHRYDDAANTLEPLIKQVAPPSTALLVAGRVALAQGNPQQAVDQMQLGLQLAGVRYEKTATAEDYEDLGRAYVKLGKKPEATAAFEHSLALNPSSMNEHNSAWELAQLDEGTSDTKAHIAHLRSSLTARRNNVDLRLQLSDLYAAQGDKAEALTFAWSAARLQPDSLRVQQTLAQAASAAHDKDLEQISSETLKLIH